MCKFINWQILVTAARKSGAPHSWAGTPFLETWSFLGRVSASPSPAPSPSDAVPKTNSTVTCDEKKKRHPTHATKSINCSVTYLNCFCSISKNWQIWSFFVVEIWDLSTQIFEAVFKMSSSENESDIWVIYYTALRKLFWLENLTTKLTMFPLIRDVLWLRSCASARAIKTHPRDFLMNI